MLAKYSITLLYSLTSRCPKLLTISLQELLRFVKVVELFNNSIHIHKNSKTSQNERKCPFKAFCFRGGNFTLFIQKRHTERFCALSVDLGSGNTDGSGVRGIVKNLSKLDITKNKVLGKTEVF